VHHSTKAIAAWLGLVAFAVVAGCNRGGDGARTAAIGGAASSASAEKPSSAKSPSNPEQPLVLIETSVGKITLRLDSQRAPLTVDNFLSYVGAGHYDRTIIHQVYKGQGILGGGYGENLLEKSARTPIRNEASNGLKNRRGAIAMVRLPDGIDSATCQFFINVADNPALDYRDRTPAGYGYCVFGEVVEGMDVVDRINDAPVHDTPDFERTPVEPIVVKSMRRIQ
jgi:cyclophilin family peptidyl-prolyl cis-trans isomerase